MVVAFEAREVVRHAGAVSAVCVKEEGGGIPIADAWRIAVASIVGSGGRGAARGAGEFPGGWRR